MYFQGYEQNFAGGIDKLLLAAQEIEAAPPSPPQPQNPTGACICEFSQQIRFLNFTE